MIDAAKISMNYIKKLAYTGSYQGMRYMMKKVSKKEKDKQREEVTKDYLRTFVWPEPLAFAKTDPEKISSLDFPFSQTGKQEAVAWLNEVYLRDYSEKK